MTNTLRGYLRFFWAGMMHNGQTGAVVPSQRFLIAKMIAPVPRAYTGQIVELGAGTGALTSRLAFRCPEATVQAWEINPTLARDLRENLARVGLANRVEVITDSAENLAAHAAQRGQRGADFVLSGIPLGNLDRERTQELIGTIYQALAKDGLYIQFQHSLMDRKKIAARFATVRTVPVLLNFPPAVVYYARR